MAIFAECLAIGDVEAQVGVCSPRLDMVRPQLAGFARLRAAHLAGVAVSLEDPASPPSHFGGVVAAGAFVALARLVVRVILPEHPCATARIRRFIAPHRGVAALAATETTLPALGLRGTEKRDRAALFAGALDLRATTGVRRHFEVLPCRLAVSFADCHVPSIRQNRFTNNPRIAPC